MVVECIYESLGTSKMCRSEQQSHSEDWMQK
jgi:hypothetical protein